MLPKNLRLNSKEIPRIAKQGKRIGGDLFDTKVWWDDKLDSPKFAISISTKIDKRSTVRNKIKRKMRSAIIALSKGNVRKGSYLFIIKSDTLQDMKSEDILNVFKSLKI